MELVQELRLREVRRIEGRQKVEDLAPQQGRAGPALEQLERHEAFDVARACRLDDLHALAGGLGVDDAVAHGAVDLTEGLLGPGVCLAPYFLRAQRHHPAPRTFGLDLHGSPPLFPAY